MQKKLEKLNITHVITGLEYGGAENMLGKLLKHLASSDISLTVLSLTTIGPVGQNLGALGIPVESLNASPGKIPSVGQVLKLIRLIRKLRPNIIQGWMYHGNLAATFAGIFFFPKPKILWNIRQSIGSLEDEEALTKRVIKLSAYLSRFVEGIIYNSNISVEQHGEIGFSSTKSYFLPNGFDLKEYCPAMSDRDGLVDELRLGKNQYLVTSVARFHPKKDHDTFLKAVSLVLEIRCDVVFIAAGRGVVSENQEIWEIIKSLRLQNHVHLLGERRDIPRILASSDLFISSASWGEGFPNSIGEAMASGTPCVVTDVGESSSIVSGAGYVVESRNPSELASEILNFFKLSAEAKRNLGLRARERIEERYSIEKVAQQYLAMYESVNLGES